MFPPGLKVAPHHPSHPLLAVVKKKIKPKHHFVAATHAARARQGLPRLESDDVSDVRNLSSVHPVTPDTLGNNAISFKFPIS